MNRTRMVAGAGAAAVLALCVGTALALGGGLDRSSASGDVLPVLLDSSSSSSDTSTTEDSTSPTTSPTAFPTSDSTTSDTATPVPTAPGGAGTGVSVGADQAGRIALARVGGGHITGVEQEMEHGRLEWKIRISHAGQRWDVRVDAGNGAITRIRSDGDSGGDSGGDDDNSGRGGGDDHGGDDDNSGSGHGGGDHGGRG